MPQQFATLDRKTITIPTGSTISVKKVGSTQGYDGHCLRAYSYFGEQMPDINPDSVNSINSIEDLYPDLRQLSKAPTFALTYMGTWMTLVKNCGFTEELAKQVESRYHDLYKVSDQVIMSRIEEEAVKQGYVTLAFGLKLRTPLLKKTVLGNKFTTSEAKAEMRTAGNAMGQSWGLLNNKAAVDFMKVVWASPYRYDIMPVALIHDAIYLVIKDDLDVIEFANRELTKAMSWQDHPEIYHDEVKLGSELDLFHPNWSHAMTLNPTWSKTEICTNVDEAMAKYRQKLLEEAA